MNFPGSYDYVSGDATKTISNKFQSYTKYMNKSNLSLTYFVCFSDWAYFIFKCCFSTIFKT